MAILTKEQIELLNYKECKAALKLLNKTYDMDTAYHKLPKEVRDLCDDIGNTLLWLEDRIARFDDPRIGSMDPGAVVVPVVKKEPDPALAKRKARPFVMQGVTYSDVNEAARKTGIKKGTLQTYARRKPEQYYYID